MDFISQSTLKADKMCCDETNRLVQVGRSGALLSAFALLVVSCVDFPPFSVINAGYDSSCQRQAVVWEENANGVLVVDKTVSCQEVLAEASGYGPEMLAACTASIGACPHESDVSGDGSHTEVEVVEDVPTFDGSEVEDSTGAGGDVRADILLETGPSDVPEVFDADGGNVDVGVDADAVLEIEASSDGTSDTEIGDALSEGTEVDGPVDEAPVLQPPEAVSSEVSIAGLDPNFEGVAATSAVDLAVTFAATDSGGGDTVTVTVAVAGGTISPAAAGFTGTFPKSSEDSVTIGGVAGMAGTVVFAVTAEDKAGNTDQYYFAATINAAPSLFDGTEVFGSAKLLGDYPTYKVVVTRKDTLALSFTATDPNADQELTTTISVTGGNLSPTDAGIDTLPAETLGPAPLTAVVGGASVTGAGQVELSVVVEDSYGAMDSMTVTVVVRGPGFDFNGDGYDDLIIGRCAEIATEHYGVASVLMGKPTLSMNLEAANAELNIVSLVKMDLFGLRVANAGDRNGDGYDELAVGAPETDAAGSSNSGTTWVFSGGPESSWPSNVSGASLAISGGTDDLALGGILAAGDINGDGFSDLLVGGAFAGAGTVQSIFAFFGGLSTNTVTSSDADIEFTGLEGFGAATKLIDLDTDGYDEVVVSDNTSNSGEVYVFKGASTPPTSQAHSTADANLLGGQGLGGDVAVGDFDGDGVADLAISGFSQGQKVFVVLGAVALTGTTDPETGPHIAGSDTHELLNQLDSAGDFNGDGRDDLAIVGNADGERKVFIVLGAAPFPFSLDVKDPGTIEISLGPAGGKEVTWAGGVGDLDGDGYGEIAILHGNTPGIPDTVSVFKGAASPTDTALTGADMTVVDDLAATTRLCSVGSL